MLEYSLMTRSRWWIGALGAALLAAFGGAFAIANGGNAGVPPGHSTGAGATGRHSTAATTHSATGSRQTASSAVTTVRARTHHAIPSRHAARRLVVTVPAAVGTRWTVVARVRGRPAAWIAQRSGVMLMRFDQRRVHLTLHAGSIDGGTVGWSYGNQITRREIHLLVAAFNGGFKLNSAKVGFMSGGHVAVKLKSGLASIVTYSDGTTDIGSWQAEVPSLGRPVFSVLQNQQLLVDHGVAAATVADCVLVCWGATVRSLNAVARSSLGITRGGALVWAAAEQLTPAQLAAAQVAAGAVRAVELDINPAWVAGYLYVHTSSGPSPAPVVPGQRGIAGRLLAPYSRDFFAVVAN